MQPETGNTDIILVCHGQSVQREGDEILGWWADVQMSRAGERQMLLLGDRLRGEYDFNLLYSSPLRRGKDAAEMLACLLKVVPEEVPELRELDGGALRSLTYDQARERYPDLVVHGSFGPEDRVPGGESYADLHHRIESAMRRILRQARGKTALVVTHGGPITAFLRSFLGFSFEDVDRPSFRCDAASLHHLRVDGDDHRSVIRLNDTSHLADLPKLKDDEQAAAAHNP